MRGKVLAAASELVVANGLHNVTIVEIAQRAGVAATSVYRRWGDVDSLLLDMAAERLAHQWPLPNEGSLEGDLKSWARRIAVGINSPEEPTFLRILFATSQLSAGTRHSVLAPRIAQIETMLERNSVNRRSVPSIDAIVDHLLAPLYMRALLGLKVDETFAEKLVDRLLSASMYTK